MTNIKWYTDESAKRVSNLVEHELKKMVALVFPDHLYTHMGISRNDNTNEVTIKLHLRPVGEAYWIKERLDQQDSHKRLT